MNQDDGYDGSDDTDGRDGESHEEGYGRRDLDEVAEELSEQYESREVPRSQTEEEKDILKPNPKDGSGSEIVVGPSITNSDLPSAPEMGENIMPQKYYRETTPDRMKSGTDGENVKSSSTPRESGEGDDELEYYFSCHERMVKEDTQRSTTSDVFKGINKEDLKENYSMPEMSRSTLVDQIDYSLDGFKINESSIYESSCSEDGYMSNRNQNCSTLRENKEICTDVTPKLMGFLNREKIYKESEFHEIGKDNLERGYVKPDSSKYMPSVATKVIKQPFIITPEVRGNYKYTSKLSWLSLV